MTTAAAQIQAAVDQLRLIVDAIDAREQHRRGYASHVPAPTDAELRLFAQIAIKQLGGTR